MHRVGRRGFLAAATLTAFELPMSADVSQVKALAFDVFGTVVDWRTSVSREVAAVARRLGVELDARAFADDWRRGYGPSMDRVRRGELAWRTIDELHRMILVELLPRYGLGGLPEGEVDELNRAWHRLDPWPDAVAGLERLRRKYTLATLSNGNIALLVNMAKRAGLPWDAVLSAELFRRYKPDPETYRGAAALLGVAPAETMMVAAHPGDLRAAASAGLRTAYVARPLEWGPDARRPAEDVSTFDVRADDFNDLAEKHGV